jgi:hypothetical protein
VLNHSEKGDVTAIYDRHSYDGEKRVAFEKWDRHVREVLEGRKRGEVVPMLARVK